MLRGDFIASELVRWEGGNPCTSKLAIMLLSEGGWEFWVMFKGDFDASGLVRFEGKS